MRKVNVNAVRPKGLWTQQTIKRLSISRKVPRSGFLTIPQVSTVRLAASEFSDPEYDLGGIPPKSRSSVRPA